MAYDTANPPALVQQPVGGGAGKVWLYRSTDGAGDVDAAGYITNGLQLGMTVGDLVWVIDTNASPVVTTLHQVSAVSAAGTDLNDLTTITQTDSD
jgi:hypothetical protein